MIFFAHITFLDVITHKKVSPKRISEDFGYVILQKILILLVIFIPFFSGFGQFLGFNS